MKLMHLIAPLILTLAVMTFPGFALGQSVENFTGDTLTPAQIHTEMGVMKARQLAKYREAIAAAAPALFNETDYDAGYYRIELRADVPAKTLYGNVTMTARSLVNGLDTAALDFDATLAIDSVYLASGARLNYSLVGYALTVQLDHPYDVGSEFSFTIRYHGTPATGGFQGFSFDSRLGVPVVSSLSEPYLARTWWPCKDRPDDKADSLDIYITCDTSLFCASNGNLIDTTRNGDGTWTFNYQVRYPIATYLFSVAMSNYVVWTDWYHYGASDSMPVINHVYPDKYAYALSHWNITPYAIGVFSNLFGQYPFITEKYGHANFEWGGGMEHQTCTSMGVAYDFGFSEPVVVHELAHQWWGDMITCKSWHDIWLNEGFASYCEALYYEVKNGDAAYHSYMTGMDFTGGGTIYMYDTTNVNVMFGNIVYDKAAWMLHMLRHIVGDTTFFTIMRDYYDSPYKFGSLTSDQFRGFCESISGKDLHYFFDEWLYGTYRPRYIYSFWNEFDPSDGKYWTFFYLEQGQITLPEVFTMPIDLRFTFGPGDTATNNIFSDARKKMYFFKTSQGVSDITLDPENWILKTATKFTWTYHMIPFALDSGNQYAPYLDTILVRGGSGLNGFTITSGALPSGLTLDPQTGIISGVPTVYGAFNLTVKSDDQNSSYVDSGNFTINVSQAPGLPGDVNNDGSRNLLDIAYLIDFLYKAGTPPAIPALADPNHTCDINVLDVTYLINFQFKSGPAPLMGCAAI